MISHKRYQYNTCITVFFSFFCSLRIALEAIITVSRRTAPSEHRELRAWRNESDANKKQTIINHCWCGWNLFAECQYRVRHQFLDENFYKTRNRERHTLSHLNSLHNLALLRKHFAKQKSRTKTLQITRMAKTRWISRSLFLIV